MTEFTRRGTAADADFQEPTLYKTMLDNLGDPIILARLDQNPMVARIIFVNNSFTRLLRYTSEESVEQSIEFFFDLEQGGPRFRSVGNDLLRGEVVDLEITALRRNGDKMRQTLHMSPIRTETTTYVIASARPVERDPALEGALSDMRRQMSKLTTELHNAPARLEAVERRLAAKAGPPEFQEADADSDNGIYVGRILLVDPSEGARSDLRGALERAGLDVIEASSGNDAIKRTLDLRPQAIVLEYDLVDMDAADVIEAIHTVRPATTIYVLSSEDEAVATLAMGAARVFDKADLPELVEQLKATL